MIEALEDGCPKYYNSQILSRYFRKDYYEWYERQIKLLLKRQRTEAEKRKGTFVLPTTLPAQTISKLREFEEVVRKANERKRLEREARATTKEPYIPNKDLIAAVEHIERELRADAGTRGARAIHWSEAFRVVKKGEKVPDGLVDFSRTFLNECNKKALINQKLNASQLQKQQWRDFL